MALLENVLVVALMGFCLLVSGQSSQEELYQTLKKKDSLLFDAAFNTCGVNILHTLFTEDFEFYHDKVGLTQGKEAFVGSIAKNCSGRNKELPQPAKRILVAGSLEVYPLFNDGKLYGAVQHGVHHFEFLNQNQQYEKGDIAKFTHVWVLQDGTWKIKRELSYDHHLQEQ
ncbi:nuclear transport factor 2 family protein [Croceitalea dokdonensis]|uniref:nuclear transport factor 2 family protein n=1 Tax=Croceitalea dokdonensis TaxID=346188 RepID=UPI0006CA0D87|nr:nuclear transport factor 2 family protein [Croceitalea dokdonensis]